MPLRNLPPALVGKRLVQISDLHVSRVVSYAYLQHALAQAAELKPDIVMVTGDLMTAMHLEQVEPVVALLRQLNPDHCAIYAVPGNHDYGAFCREVGQVEGLSRAMKRVGIRLLRNEITEYEGLQIVGFDELHAALFSRPRRSGSSTSPAMESR